MEVPAPDAASPAARLLDRTGNAVPVPVVSAVRDDADGSRWQTAQLALVPLAPGDYIVELTQLGAVNQTERRTLVAFRVVP